jgi:hypothetical protein
LSSKIAGAKPNGSSKAACAKSNGFSKIAGATVTASSQPAWADAAAAGWTGASTTAAAANKTAMRDSFTIVLLEDLSDATAPSLRQHVHRSCIN